MGDDSSKITVRGPEEFWDVFDEYWEEEGYDSRSDAVRDNLEELVEGNLLPKDQIEIGFQMYISGWANSDLRSAEKGIDLLYNVDEDIGDIAEHYLETSDPEYWA